MPSGRSPPPPRSTAPSSAPRRRATPGHETTIPERQKILTHFVDALLLMNDDIVPELAWQMGRPIRFGGEKRGVEERSRYMIELAAEALAPSIKPEKEGFTRYITREALGTVMVIAPWNYPFLTAVNSIVPGLMAGNAIILKHASQTLLAGERFAARRRKRRPAGRACSRTWCSAMPTPKSSSARAPIDHINFTGSVEGGRRIEKAAAGTFATLGLELGGKDPAYVRADANLDNAVENLVDGSFFNSGQSCCGVERIYVHESVYGNFVERFIDNAKGWTLGNPLDPDTIVGPMARGNFADHVRQQTEEALRGGATRHLNTRHDLDKPGSPYLAPEVLTNVNHQMSRHARGELRPRRRHHEGGRRRRSHHADERQPLWPHRLDLDRGPRRRGQASARSIETGTVFANRCDYLDPALVWTGVKDTGKGGGLSEIGYANLTQPKSYHLKRV